MTIMMRILMSIHDHDTDQVLEKSTLMSIYDGDPVEDPDKDPTFKTVTLRFTFDQTQNQIQC